MFFFFVSSPVLAANFLDVVINEIAWMGRENSFNDEWLELYNNTQEDILLEGWVLKAEDGSPEIELKGVIPAQGFYLLERTDDNTVPEIPANQIYRGSLKNSGENLELYDNFGNLVDKVNCRAGWFAGNKETKQTMERKNPKISGNNPENWQDSQVFGGTPKAKNSSGNLLGKNRSLNNSKNKKEGKKRQYPSGIIFNEILPSPEGPDSENEWIELFNQNSFEVDLSGWQIADEIGSSKIFTIPENTKISGQGFLLLTRPLTKIILNNSGDSLMLIQPNGNILDKVTFEKAPKGKSYSLIDSRWVWSSILTPGEENIVLKTTKTEKIESQSSFGKTPFKKAKNEESQNLPNKEKALAGIKESFNKKDFFFSLGQPPNFWTILLIGFSVAIFSGVIILIIRKKTKKSSDK